MKNPAAINNYFISSSFGISSFAWSYLVISAIDFDNYDLLAFSCCSLNRKEIKGMNLVQIWSRKEMNFLLFSMLKQPQSFEIKHWGLCFPFCFLIRDVPSLSLRHIGLFDVVWNLELTTQSFFYKTFFPTLITSSTFTQLAAVIPVEMLRNTLALPRKGFFVAK